MSSQSTERYNEKIRVGRQQLIAQIIELEPQISSIRLEALGRERGNLALRDVLDQCRSLAELRK